MSFLQGLLAQVGNMPANRSAVFTASTKLIMLFACSWRAHRGASQTARPGKSWRRSGRSYS